MSKKDSVPIENILRIEGVNAKGFGTVPKTAMTDKRLTLCAKAIYAYFCSYSGNGVKAFPPVTKILHDLNISKNYYYKNISLLKKCDYIHVDQERVSGKFTRNIYTLVPCPSTGETETTQPCRIMKETVHSPHPTTGDTVIKDTNINKINKDISNPPTTLKNIGDGGLVDVKKQIQVQIDYDLLVTDESKKHLDCIVNVMADTLRSAHDSFWIGGVQIDSCIVKQRFSELDFGDISYILSEMKRPRKIRNPKGYMRSVLYNAPASSELYWSSEICNTLAKYEHHQNKQQQTDALQEVQSMES